MNQNLWRKHAMRYFQITLGCLLVCLGFNLFLIPAHLLTGGISGVALIIYYLIGLPVGMQNLVYNLPILYLAYRVFGRFLVDWSICSDPMLNSIFGGVLAGVGFGMVFRANANTGGLDVIAAVAKKYYSLDVGTVVFMLNFLIIMGSVALFGVEVALFSIVSIYVTAELTNRVAAGLNREKSILIVSPQAKAICNDIMENVHRGATFLDGRGGLAEEPKNILFVVVSLTQVSRVKTIVSHHDPQAFMIVSDTSEDARRKWQQTHEKQLEFEQLHGRREK